MKNLAAACLLCFSLSACVAVDDGGYGYSDGYYGGGYYATEYPAYRRHHYNGRWQHGNWDREHQRWGDHRR